MRRLCLFVLFLISLYVCLICSARSGNMSVVITTMQKPIDAALCYDQNYLLSYDNNSISLWDLNSRRMVRNLPCATDYVKPSPLGTEWVNVKMRKTITDIYSKYYAVNLISGEFIPLNHHKKSSRDKDTESPNYKDSYFMTHHPDIDFIRCDEGIILQSKDGNIIDTLSSLSTARCGRIALDSKDSLLLVSGNPTFIYDLKNARLSTMIYPAIDNDSVLYWYSGYSASSGRFVCDDKIQVTARQKKIETYSITGRLLESIDTDNLVYSFAENNGDYIAGSFYGIYTGNAVSGRLRLDTMRSVDPLKKTKLPNRNVYAIEELPHNGGYICGSMFGDLFVGDFSNPQSHKRLEYPAIDSDNLREIGAVLSPRDIINGRAILDLSISPDEQYVLLGFSGGRVFECPLDSGLPAYYYNSYQLFASYHASACAYLNDSTIIVGNGKGDIGIWKRGRYKEFRIIENAHADIISDIILTKDGSKVISASRDGIVTIWDASCMEKIMSIYPIGINGDYIFLTPDNFYKSSKPGTDAISFVDGLNAYSFDQFDLQYNRPDIILERLGATSETTDYFRKAWAKRVSRSGFDETTIYDDIEVPQLSMPNLLETEKVTSNKNMILNLDAYDSKYRCHAIKVSINGVSVENASLDSLIQNKSVEGKHLLFELPVELAYGKNHIDISITNEIGVESYPVTLEIVCTAKPSKRTLFVVGIGVSDYEQNSFNLKYADRDASDFVEVFSKTGSKLFDEVRILSLCNENFNSAAITQVEKFFSEGKRDDVQLLLYAGHGVIDKNMDYFLSTYDMDFNNPATHGIAYEKFVESFAKSQSLNKACFIDACHSGELFKDEYISINSPVEVTGKLVFRGAGDNIGALSRETERLSSLISDFFIDVRKNSGVTVIASAGGTELAFEDDRWGNGVFTWCIKDGVLNDKADSNNDGCIELDELVSYVRTRVRELSNNAQTPVARTINRYANQIILK